MIHLNLFFQTRQVLGAVITGFFWTLIQAVSVCAQLGSLAKPKLHYRRGCLFAQSKSQTRFWNSAAAGGILVTSVDSLVCANFLLYRAGKNGFSSRDSRENPNPIKTLSPRIDTFSSPFLIAGSTRTDGIRITNDFSYERSSYHPPRPDREYVTRYMCSSSSSISCNRSEQRPGQLWWRWWWVQPTNPETAARSRINHHPPGLLSIRAPMTFSCFSG